MRAAWMHAFTAGVCVTLACTGESSAALPKPLTLEQAFETTRVMLNPESVSRDNPDGVMSVSPDGRRYVIRLIQGDIARNGVLMRILTGELSSAETTARFSEVAALLSSGRGAGITSYLGPDLDASSDESPVRWLDSRRIAFLRSDAQDRRQVVSVDLVTREVHWLTHHPRSVAAFDMQGDRIVFAAAAELPRERSGDDGDFTIGDNIDGWSVLRGDFSNVTLTDRRMNTRWYVRELKSGETHALTLTANGIDLDVRHVIAISPDSHWAVVDVTPDVIPAEWDVLADESDRGFLAEARLPVRSGTARNIHQLYVVDLDKREGRALWNTYTVAARSKLVWSPDSTRVLVIPATLPGETSHVAAAVVSAHTGQFETLPLERAALGSIEAIRFSDNARIEIAERRGEELLWRVFEREGAQWLETPRREPQRSRTTLRLQQSLNTPPKIVAADHGAKPSLLVDLALPLKNTVLGRAERVSGTLSSGESWEGLLFYPVHYDSSRRYAAVLQSVYGTKLRDEFTLYGVQGGEGLGPSVIAPYVPQFLAGGGVAVLQVDVRGRRGTPRKDEVGIRQRLFEEAAAFLVQKGIALEDRIGLVGFSRNGWYVQHTLVHSKFPFAAAIAADNFDPSYVASVLGDGTQEASATYGAPPFGEGLNVWVQQASGFNADKIRTPLMMTEMSSGGRLGVIVKWELFSRLRSLNRPVEMYVMPDVALGAHNTQNPKQVLAVQARTIDWLRFWLQDYEDDVPSKATQYRDWRRLRDRVPIVSPQ